MLIKHRREICSPLALNYNSMFSFPSYNRLPLMNPQYLIWYCESINCFKKKHAYYYTSPAATENSGFDGCCWRLWGRPYRPCSWRGEKAFNKADSTTDLPWSFVVVSASTRCFYAAASNTPHALQPRSSSPHNTPKHPKTPPTPYPPTPHPPPPGPPIAQSVQHPCRHRSSGRRQIIARLPSQRRQIIARLPS